MEYIKLEFTVVANHPGPAGGKTLPGGQCSVLQSKPQQLKTTKPVHRLTADRIKTPNDSTYEQKSWNQVYRGTHNRVQIHDRDAFHHNEYGTTCGFPEMDTDGFMHQWLFLDKGGLIRWPVIFLYYFPTGYGLPQETTA